MYFNPANVMELLQQEYAGFLADLGDEPDPFKRRDLSLAMWPLAWYLDDWDRLPYKWRCNLFYFAQTLVPLHASMEARRGPDMARFVYDYVEGLWARKTRFYVGKRAYCSPREMYWEALNFLPGHDYYDAMWTLLDTGIEVL